MNLNRNNYEEFFLMYVDGELQAQQKNEVEFFVQQNPDLQSELEMLQQATLTVDELMPMDKTSLYKTENGITQTNYAEYFLLYVDNELTDAERKNTEIFVLQHPQLQEEFTLLKQTQLPAEKISCPNKELLYKKEEDKKPIVWMNWSRVAVAAAFIGIAVSVWVLYPSTKTTTGVGSLAVKETTTKQNEKLLVPTKSVNGAVASINNSTNNKVVKQQAATTTASINKNDLATTTKTNILPTKKIIAPLVTFKNQETFTNNTIAQVSGKEDKKEQTIESATKTLIEALNNNKVDIAKNANTVVKENKEIITSIAQPIIYKELDTDIPENKTVLVGGLEIRKDKLVGLFKRASKMIKSGKEER